METTEGQRSDEAELKNVVDGDDDLSVESVKAKLLPTFPFALVFDSPAATTAFVRAESGIDSDIFAGEFGKMLVTFLCFGLWEKHQTVLFYHFFLSGKTSPFRSELILNKTSIFPWGVAASKAFYIKLLGGLSPPEVGSTNRVCQEPVAASKY